MMQKEETLQNKPTIHRICIKPKQLEQQNPIKLCFSYRLKLSRSDTHALAVCFPKIPGRAEARCLGPMPVLPMRSLTSSRSANSAAAKDARLWPTGVGSAAVRCGKRVKAMVTTEKNMSTAPIMVKALGTWWKRTKSKK